MDVDADRLTSGLPLAAAVGVLADQFLLLGVDADDRFPGSAVHAEPLVEVTELGIAVRVLSAFDGLGVALQAEACLPQQVTHRIGACAVTLPGELARQCAQGLGGPPQRRHRITALSGSTSASNDGAAGSRSARRLRPRRVCGPGPAAKRRPPARGPPATPWPPDPRRAGHDPDTAVPQDPRLRPHQQPPLPLIRMREDRPELRRQQLPGIRHALPHTTTRARVREPAGYLSTAV